MSLPDKPLFYKVAEVKIADRKFIYPPFSIEFSQTLQTGKISTSNVKLYNPAPETIKLAEGIPTGTTKIYPNVTVSAGYETDYGITVYGEIIDYKVVKENQDTILEMNISDITSTWANFNILESWTNSSTTKILSEMLDLADIKYEISLGEDKIYSKCTAKNFRRAVKNILKDTKSQFCFKNGVMIIEPKTPILKQESAFISPETGLLGKIEKNSKGYLFKTLFLYKIQIGDIVKIEDKNIPSSRVKIIEVKRNFSTFGDSGCVFKAVEVI